MIRCKFYVASVKKQASAGSPETTAESVELQAVTGKENEPWSKYTPSGSLNLYITNPAAFGQLVPGTLVYIDITQIEGA